MSKLMHNVRAYTVFDFLVFYIIAYTALKIFFAVFYI